MKHDFHKFYTDEASVYQNRRYSTRYGRLFASLHHEAIFLLLDNQSRDFKILEIACGTGHTTGLLSLMGFGVTACDLTEAMMKQAVERVKGSPATTRFVRTDARCLPFPDNSFDIVVSTRFLHLFSHDEQSKLLDEMLRVLRPGGYILVDYDNWFSRWMWAAPYAIYNIVKYRRLAPYSIYNRIAKTRSMISEKGVDIKDVVGVGGTHLILVSWLSIKFALKLGKWHQKPGLRLFAEQFIVFGEKG